MESVKKEKQFIGDAKVYDKDIFINTENGTGYEQVIKEMKNFINYTANKYKLANTSKEDLKQNIIIRILEGIRKYDPDKNVKLSTFLQIRVINKLINDIRDESRFDNNPSILKITSYSISCKCGHKFYTTISKNDDIEYEKCLNCNNILKGSKCFVINYPPKSIQFDASNIYDDNYASGDKSGMVGENDKDIPLFRGERTELEKSVMFNNDLSLILSEKEDEEIFRSVCVEENTIDATAKRLNISSVKVKNRLNSLKKKPEILDLLNR